MKLKKKLVYSTKQLADVLTKTGASAKTSSRTVKTNLLPIINPCKLVIFFCIELELFFKYFYKHFFLLIISLSY